MNPFTQSITQVASEILEDLQLVSESTPEPA
jgi:hypothetical protein